METKTEKKDVHQIISEIFIKMLGNKHVPWLQSFDDAGIPRNLVTQKPYKGINIWLLSSLGYPLNYFLTAKQLSEIGGEIKENEKPHIATQWKKIDENTNETNGRLKLQYFKIHNLAQCTGIPEVAIPVFVRLEPILRSKAIITEMNNAPKIVKKAQPATYYPQEDYIAVSKRIEETDPDRYYFELFRELVRSCWHKDRLNKEQHLSSAISDPKLSVKTQLAELLAASYLDSYTGFNLDLTDDVSIVNIPGWIQAMLDDKRFIVNSASLAQKAVDYILGDTAQATADS